MESATLIWNEERIAYRFGGTGKELLCCFHGYGESANTFDFLEERLGNQYTLIAIDMPYHGNTLWQHTTHFTRDDLVGIVACIREQHDRMQEKISLLGYSMGGRMVLQLAEMIPEQVRQLVMLAPDGLKVNFWYWLSTQTWIGNRIFRFTIHHPGIFLWFLNICNRLKWVNQSVFKFVHFYLDNREVRKLLYLRWTCLSKIKPDLKKIKEQLLKEEIPVQIVYGKHDRIILPDRGYLFREGIESLCQIEILNTGHQILQVKNIDSITRYFGC